MAWRESARAVAKSALLLGVSSIAFGTAAYADGNGKTFDIPAQPAATGIQEFAREANVQILISADDIRGKQSNAIHGSMGVHDALSQLLAGTAVTVASDDGKTIVLTGEKKSATADTRATGVMVAQARTAAAPPMAGAPALPPQNAAQISENVVITGSLIRGAAPVGLSLTSLGGMDFVQSGAITTSDLFKKLPSVLSTGDSFVARVGNVIRVAPVNIHYVGYTDTLMLLDGMRFPLESQDLTLHDPSVAPSLALSSVDVFADGASATYGADAVAGVVNLVLKRNYDGAVSQVHYGYGDGASSYQLSQLWGRTWKGGDITATYEFYHKDPILASQYPWFTSDYSSYLAGANLDPLVASAPATVLANTSPFFPASPTAGFPSIAVPSCGNCYAIPSNQDGGYSLHLGNSTTTGLSSLVWGNITAAGNGTGAKNTQRAAWASPNQDRNGATVTFDQDVTDGVRLVVDGLYSNRRGDVLQPTVFGGAVTVPTGNPYYPVGGPAFGLSTYYDINTAELHRVVAFSELDLFGSAALEIDLPYGWQARLSQVTSAVDSIADTRNAANTDNMKAALSPTPVTVTAVQNGTLVSFPLSKPANVPFLNLFCDATAFTCNDPATLAYITGETVRQGYIRTHQYNAGLDGKLFALPGGDVRLAVGGDYYDESYIFKLFDSVNSIAVSDPTVTNIASTRNAYSGYGELLVPIVGAGNAFPGVKKLQLTVAGRFDSYSDFGSTTNPSVRGEWEIVDGVSLRASWGTGFRAPTLANTSNGASRMINGYGPAVPGLAVAGSTASPIAAGTGDCTANVISMLPAGTTQCTGQLVAGLVITGPAGGLSSVGLSSRPSGSSLQPELSTTYSFGTKIAPPQIAGLDIDISYFNVDVRGQLLQAGNNTSLFRLDPVLQNFVTFLPSSTTVNKLLALPGAVIDATGSTLGQAPATVKFIIDGSTINAGELKTDGIDLSANYVREIGDLGTWNIGLTATWFNSYTQSLVQGSPFVSYLNTNAYASQSPVPLRIQARGQIGWTNDVVSVNLFANYQPSFANLTPPAGAPAAFNRVASFTTLDLAASYDLGDTPSNDYLKGISFQLSILNLMSKKPPVAIGDITATTGTAFEASHTSPAGRTWGFTLTKKW